MDPVILSDTKSPPHPRATTPQKKLLLAAGGIAATGAEIISYSTGRDDSWGVILLAIISILAAGLPTMKKGWIALKNMALNIYFLMSLAVAGAVATGKWPEAAMVLFLFAIAEAIEVLSLDRVRRGISGLSAMAPETAETWMEGIWKSLPVADVKEGMKIRIKTGSRVPLDARILSGWVAVNQSPVTGESLPVDKAQGDELYAGSIITDGVVEATVTAVAQESTLARIAAALQNAQSQRAPTQRLVERFAHYYTPVVVAFAVAVAVVPPLFLGGFWDKWFYEALVILVIACPCALVISTPVTVASGIAAAARHGILIKGGGYLENGRLIKALALDKTGTLTTGKPELTDISTFAVIPEDEALLIAASLDEQSAHPVARALVSEWRRRGASSLFSVEEFSVMNGNGAQGKIGGKIWKIGNKRFLASSGLLSETVAKEISRLESEGKTVATLFSEKEVAAVFGLADCVRSESREAVRMLDALKVKTVILTGDNPAAASRVAVASGISEFRDSLMPEEKEAAIREIRNIYGFTGMVGDGINDTPALAGADIGFAMGAAGSDSAVETADVAVMDDDLRKIAVFIRLSRRCVTVLKQNISLAIGIKVLFLILAMTGDATLWMAVFADTGASLLVVSNGLRLFNHPAGS